MTLEEQATQFAQELTSTVHAVSPDCDSFVPIIIEGKPRVSVRQPREGIALHVDQKPLLKLKVLFECVLDGDHEFMAIEKSSVQVFPRTGGHPLFRYEYERAANTVPAAHMHVHAHRDAFTYLMAKSGSGTRRGRRRREADSVPSIEQLHFPLGGHRFRPCLEDILHMLIDEFGIDSHAGTFAVLEQGRAEWRRKQTRSVVRDDPESAVAALQKLGYDVSWPRAGSPEPHVRWDRLQSR